MGNYLLVHHQFWGNPDNNYGFGSSNISQNIQNVINQLNNGATPTLQMRTPTPWSTTAAPTNTTQTPWRNNQTLTPLNGGYDLSSYGQSNGNSKSIDYSLYGDGFSKEFIDKMEGY